MSGQNPREIALDTLHADPGEEFIEERLHRVLAQARLSTPDRALCQELTYGVVRWQATLDYLIDRKLRGRPPGARTRNVLRLGLYQLFWLSRIPPHALVNETVELAKRGAAAGQPAFVNAVLRDYLREADQTRRLLDQLKNERPSLGYSHPAWLVERWENAWGKDAARRLMEWNNLAPKTFARVNRLKAEPNQLVKRWQEEGVQHEPVQRDWLEPDQVFELSTHPPLEQLPSFQDGWFYVQDPSTLLAVKELAPQPEETVLDLCAAPGGKSCYAAELMRNTGRLLAHDTSRARLELVEENCARLGITCVQPILPSKLAVPEKPAASATQQLESSAGPAPVFDRVVIDAPCSNSGVMRRRVDLRWRIRIEEIRRLQRRQLELLRRAASLVKPSGVVVYSTCSLEPEENEHVMRAFLSEQPQFVLERARQLLPFVDQVDGAYVAKLRRR